MGIYYLFCYFEKQPPGVSAMPWPSTDDEMVMMKKMMMIMMLENKENYVDGSVKKERLGAPTPPKSLLL